MAGEATRPTCLICDCGGTMPAPALSEGSGVPAARLHTQLCRDQLSAFEKALAQGEPLLVACTQEAPLFHEVATEAGAGDRVGFFNIREAAGWAVEADAAAPKIAALRAAAAVEVAPARLKAIESDGLALVYGTGQAAVDAARLLSARLSVTLLMPEAGDAAMPPGGDIPVYRGRVATMTGAFGAFALTIDDYAPLLPQSRAAFAFEAARDGAATSCAVVVDLTGGPPLVPGHLHRDGYLRADPGNPAEVLRAILAAGELVGTFEKPIYVDYDAATCAHSRSRITGCSRCLDACPAGAVAELGDGVAIDAGICGGCGSCASVCPTGSISYLYPDRAGFAAKVQAMAHGYASAGGTAPVLLLHDAGHGTPLIAAMARFGRGLPARVVPLELHAATLPGHVELLGALAAGFAGVAVLADPRLAEELPPLRTQMALAEGIAEGLCLGAGRLTLLAEADPDAVEAALHGAVRHGPLPARRFAATGGKRDVARTVLSVLRPEGGPDILPVPPGAPYGRIAIDTEACTLCMACVSACPTGAMLDTPGEPTLRFTEAACVQCGLCVGTCPENALAPEPRLNLAPAAMQPVTLHHEEPFECIECGKPFATRATIARIKDQLAGKHAMFASPERARLIEMCEDCRVTTQAAGGDDPFATGARARTRTTDDYLKARDAGLSAEDFLIED